MIIPIGYAQVTHHFSGPTLPHGAVTTYGIQLLGSVGIVDRAIAVYNAFQGTLMQVLADDVIHEAVTVKYGPNNVGPMYEQGGSGTGGATGDVSPPQVTYLIQKKGSLGGRSNRGRMYLPGVVDTAVEADGAISSTYMTALTTEADAFLADLITAECPMYILHNASSDPTEVQSLSASTRAATQRRRLRG